MLRIKVCKKNMKIKGGRAIGDSLESIKTEN